MLSYALTGWKRVESKNSSGTPIVNYHWVNDTTVNDVPNNAQYVDTHGRVIQLWGDDETNSHAWGVVDPAKPVVSDQPGDGPPSYRNYGDTRAAVVGAGYQYFYDPHPDNAGGFNFAKKESPTLNITIFTEDCCLGGVPSRSDRVIGVDAHTELYSPISDKTKHIMKEVIPNLWDRIRGKKNP